MDEEPTDARHAAYRFGAEVLVFAVFGAIWMIKSGNVWFVLAGVVLVVFIVLAVVGFVVQAVPRFRRRWHRTETTPCPVCGRRLDTTPNQVGGGWTLPRPHGQLEALCKDQHGTDHGVPIHW